MAIKKKSGDFEFDKNSEDFKKFQREAPKKIANQSLNHFLLGFRNGGGQTDKSRGGWERRKKRDTGRAILVKSGALRRDIKKLKQTFQEILIGTSRIQYAERHNEGLTDRRGRKMPQREFIGDSQTLNKKNFVLLRQLMNKVMRV